MREVKAKVGGLNLTLSANWRASMEIAEQVGDPMMIAREAAKEEIFSQKGLSYNPSFVFDVDNVPTIIFIGAVQGGFRGDIDDVREAVFEHGFFEAQDLAGKYLTLIVSPQSAEAKKSTGKKKAETT